jgi:hypothetical protein
MKSRVHGSRVQGIEINGAGSVFLSGNLAFFLWERLSSRDDRG